jgi:hypothetical protein
MRRRRRERFPRALGRAILAGAVTVCTPSCTGGDPAVPPRSACVEGLSTSCQPLYPPTFHDLFTRTLVPTCAQPGVCHAADAARGGLVFEDEDAAYADLLGQRDGRIRVKAKDPACSPLVERIESTDPAMVMPPGKPLDPALACSFVLWIANGAAR